MKNPQRILFGLLALLLIGGSLRLIIAQLSAAPESDSKTHNIAELIEERDEARRTRDQLQRDLDAMTRERVDLDGELNRLKKEVEKLKLRQF